MSVTLTPDEWELVRQGFYPRDMDDKWHVGYAPPFLEMYRSWTGTLVFKLQIDPQEDAVHCGPLYAARGEDWYKHNPTNDEVAMAKKVIEYVFHLEGFGDR